MMCAIAGVSRSGFYKWRKRGGKPPKNRVKVLKAVKECHKAHTTRGYRWVHAYLTQEGKIDCSAEYVRKAFAYLGISAKTKHKAKKYKRKVKDPYPNLIFSTWKTIDRPRQVIVSDMTALKYGYWGYCELALCFDVFTKQIVGSGLGGGRGGNAHYYTGLFQAISSVEQAREKAVEQLEEGSSDITVFHTDQGSVYTSMEYNAIIKEHNLVRSCSRAGRPTDNPVNESLNGWIKEELYCDFHLGDARSSSEVASIIERYIEWCNSKRPSFALGYKTPDGFYEDYMQGRIERKNTFCARVLDETPKFVREKLAKAENIAQESRSGIGSSNAFLFG